MYYIAYDLSWGRYIIPKLMGEKGGKNAILEPNWLGLSDFYQLVQLR